MTPLSLSLTWFAGRCWVLPEEYCGFLGDVFWFILVFSFAWFDSGYMSGVAWCVSTAPCTLQSLVPCWSCLRSTGVWIILGDHFQMVLRRPGCFHALLREGGPRILRSIPPCAGGYWTYFTHFMAKMDSFPRSCSRCGYTLMRQSTVTFGRNSHIFLMKVDLDPVHELSR